MDAKTADLTHKTTNRMDAMFQREYGASQVLEMTTVPVSGIESDEVLVEVHAAGARVPAAMAELEGGRARGNSVVIIREVEEADAR